MYIAGRSLSCSIFCCLSNVNRFKWLRATLNKFDRELRQNISHLTRLLRFREDSSESLQLAAPTQISTTHWVSDLHSIHDSRRCKVHWRNFSAFTHWKGREVVIFRPFLLNKRKTIKNIRYHQIMNHQQPYFQLAFSDFIVLSPVSSTSRVSLASARAAKFPCCTNIIKSY